MRLLKRILYSISSGFMISASAFCILGQSGCVSKTSAMKENLKGQVKSVSTRDGENFSKKTFFDETGRLTRKEVAGNRETPTSIYEYAYDRKGRLISHCRYRADDPHNKVTYEYAYNKGGVMESRHCVTYDSWTYYEYDKKGNCVLERDPDGVDKYKKMIYNKKNQLIEDFPYDPEEKTIHAFGTDDDGNHWEEDDPMPPYEGWHTYYEYNDFGDVVRLSVKTPSGDLCLTDHIAYEYDHAGNWVKRIHNRVAYDYDVDDEGNEVWYESEFHNRVFYPNRDTELFEEGNLVTRTIEYYQ